MVKSDCWSPRQHITWPHTNCGNHLLERAALELEEDAVCSWKRSISRYLFHSHLLDFATCPLAPSQRHPTCNDLIGFKTPQNWRIWNPFWMWNVYSACKSNLSFWRCPLNRTSSAQSLRTLCRSNHPNSVALLLQLSNLIIITGRRKYFISQTASWLFKILLKRNPTANKSVLVLSYQRGGGYIR